MMYFEDFTPGQYDIKLNSQGYLVPTSRTTVDYLRISLLYTLIDY